MRVSAELHHLILHVGVLSTIHHVAALVLVLDVGEAEWTTAILIAGELSDGCGRVVLAVELDNASTTRATIRLILDLGTLDLADRGEELD